MASNKGYDKIAQLIAGAAADQDELKKAKAKFDKEILNEKKLTAWQLRRQGWKVPQVAQALKVSITTVKRWDKQVKDNFSDLPGVQIAKDVLQSLLPEATDVYRKSLRSPDPRVRKETAKDILSNFSVLQEKIKHEHEITGSESDAELIAEAERIIAGAKRTPQSDQ